MRILLLGSGGRESALAWALARSPSVKELVVAPGNPGIARLATTRSCDIDSPHDVVALARDVGAALVVVGPEAPLVAGVGDALRADGFPVFGPDQAAARIEGSKEHAKELMDRAGIPTASWAAFSELGDAVAYLDSLEPPYVIKADGLAAGKGVSVVPSRDDAVDALEERLVRGAYGSAGDRVVIEEFLDGQECSLIAFTDGKAVVPCAPAQDYKRIADGDRGPNTGGMGSYSPVPACPPHLLDEIVDTAIRPMVDVTREAGAPFQGALYAGLALTSRGPRVIEFNARFGDPETQALMPRVDFDLAEVCMAAATGGLEGAELKWRDEACVSVVLAARGYPGTPEKGQLIHGLDEAAALPGVEIFHAGTSATPEGVVTAGGRVLAVTALGTDFADARARAYAAAETIRFDGKQMRTDIAKRAEEAE